MNINTFENTQEEANLINKNRNIQTNILNIGRNTITILRATITKVSQM
jgi:hypothetical protein